jgi:hypothetical protein
MMDVTDHRVFQLFGVEDGLRRAILLGMPSVHFDLSHLPLTVVTPPLLVWAWGHALTQLATGIERLRTAFRNDESDRGWRFPHYDAMERNVAAHLKAASIDVRRRLRQALR